MALLTDGAPVDRRYLDAIGVRQWVRRDWQALPSVPGVEPKPKSESEQATVEAVRGGESRLLVGAEQRVVSVPVAPEQPVPTVPLASGQLDANSVAAVSASANPASSLDLDWQTLQASVASCRQCELHTSRTQTVFGVGDPHADWMLIGEAPGADEDRLGEPFVGRSGKLLDQMLQAVGFSRERVFIANTLKCRPPNNRDPLAAESACCRPWLQRQIELIQPKVIMAVGGVAAKNLLNTREATGALRGRVHQYGSIPLVVSYHPAYLLRSPSQKRKAWQDLLLVKRVLDSAS